MSDSIPEATVAPAQAPAVAPVSIVKLDGSTIAPATDTPDAPGPAAAATSVVVAGYVPARSVPVEQIVPVIPTSETLTQPVPPSTVATYPPSTFPDEELVIPDSDDAPPPGAIVQQPVDQLISAACPWHTAGGSLMGWSKLKCAKLCRRKFCYEYVLGLRPRRDPQYVQPDQPLADDDLEPVDDKAKKRTPAGRISALDLGILVHACIEAFYRTGDLEQMWTPAEAVKRQYPALALECRRLVNFYMRRFNQEEADTWDNRAVERESRYYFPARRCAGKRRALCLSSRHDGIYRKIYKGQARLPPGKPATDGQVRLHELKCLDVDEPIWDTSRCIRTTAGELLTIGNANIPTVNLEKGELSIHDARFVSNGGALVYKTTLSSGREALLTDNHPVWTDVGWKAAGELRPGDWVGCAVPLFTGRKQLPDTEVELIGYFIGDGYIGVEETSFTTSRAALMQRVCQLLERTGATYHVSTNPKRVADILHLHKNTAFNVLLSTVGLRGCLAAAKFIPTEILGAPEKQLRTFLAALWSTDGHVGMHRSRNYSLDIHYSTMSPQLARDVQQVLWRLGIWSTKHAVKLKYKDWAARGKDVYFVKVASRAAKREFVRQVFPSMLCRTTTTGKELLAHVPLHGQDTCDSIPSSLIRAALKGGTPSELRRTNRYTGIARWIIAEVCTLAPELQSLVDSPIHWDKVKTNEKLGMRPTVAVTVPSQPVFLTGDGLITHNTTATLSYNRVRGFSMNAQLMCNILTYNYGHAVKRDGTVLKQSTADLFGPTQTVTVTWIGKNKAQDPNKDVERVEYELGAGRVEQFRDSLADWYYEEIGERLFSAHYDKPETWPMDWLGCADWPWMGAVCPYVTLCATTSPVSFDVQFERVDPLDRDALEKPKALAKLDKAAKKATAVVEGK